MSFFLSLVLLIIYIIITKNILSGDYLSFRVLPISYSPAEYYKMNSLMFYLIFTIVTAPVFLVPPFTLAKYGVYFLVLLYLLKAKDIETPDSWIVRSYWAFFIWLIICAFRGENLMDSISLLIKYLIPILSLYLGYSALRSKYDIYYLIKKVLVGVTIYTFLIGGLSAKLYSWFYFSPIGDQFLKYAGFADYLTSLFVLPFAMVWISGERKWYWVAAAMILSTILEVVRTGLGGMAIVIAVFSFFKYKFRSLPILGALAGIMLAVVLLIPDVNQKFFGEKAGKVSAEAIVNEDAISMDNISTNGREAMWTLVMAKCYDGHEIAGSGLGSAIQYLRYIRENIYRVPLLLHNDYVQTMCDTGLIGLGLLIVFFTIFLFTIGTRVWTTDDFFIRLTGIIALSSMSGIAFSMGFDNVVSHSMTSLIMPFIFTGLYLKIVSLSENDELS